MAVQLYSSEDLSAPQLVGNAGSLTTVLDAILVGTGGFAYGTTPSAGWTIAFTGTNQRDYRMITTGGALGYYISVNDNAPGAGLGKEARIRGFEAMTALGVGTNAFPTTTQAANGLFVRKSTTADTTIQRPWVAIADGRTFYFFVIAGDATPAPYLGIGFGEFYSLKANDLGRAFIIGRATENSTTTTSAVEAMDYMTVANTLATGHYVARDYHGGAGAVTGGKVGDASLSAALPIGLIGVISNTNPTDNRTYVAPVFLTTQPTGQVVFRGRMRGFWHYGHPLTSVSDGDRISGSQSILGREFYIVKSGGNSGVFTLETSQTWETN